MTALNKQALRMRNYLDTALKSGVKLLHLSTDELKGLLDELEAKDTRIVNITAERDALRESEMGDAKHSNTRAAADIYFQLVEECEIPPGGSLVEYVSNLRERAAAAGKGATS